MQEALDAKKLDGKAVITADALKEAGVINQVRDGVRLLARGELKSKVSFQIAGASAAAVAAVEKAGGKVELPAAPVEVESKKKSSKK